MKNKKIKAGNKSPNPPPIYIRDTIPTIIATIIRVVINPARTASVPVRFAEVITLIDTGTLTPIPTITATITPIKPFTIDILYFNLVNSKKS